MIPRHQLDQWHQGNTKQYHKSHKQTKAKKIPAPERGRYFRSAIKSLVFQSPVAFQSLTTLCLPALPEFDPSPRPYKTVPSPLLIPGLRPNPSKNSSKWINFEFSLEVRLTRTIVYVDYDNCEAASVSTKLSWMHGEHCFRGVFIHFWSFFYMVGRNRKDAGWYTYARNDPGSDLMSSRHRMNDYFECAPFFMLLLRVASS